MHNLFSDVEFNIKLINIQYLLNRDSEYFINSTIPNNYWKLLVPEIMTHYRKSLILDKAILKNDIYDFINSINLNNPYYVINKNYSLIDNEAIIMNNNIFIKDKCKINYINFYNKYNTYSYKMNNCVLTEMNKFIDY